MQHVTNVLHLSVEKETFSPLADVLGGIRCGVVTLLSRESGDSAARGAANGRAEEERRGRGSDRGGRGQESAGRSNWRGAKVVAAGAEGQGEERLDQAVARWRGDLFNLAESDRLDGSVVNDILVVSEDEGEEARRMAVEGGQGQPPAGAMKSILPEVRRKRRFF